MYRYSDLQKLKKTILFKFVMLKYLNSKSFTKKRLLDYLCLHYAYHFFLDGNSYVHACINYEKGLLGPRMAVDISLFMFFSTVTTAKMHAVL